LDLGNAVGQRPPTGVRPQRGALENESPGSVNPMSQVAVHASGASSDRRTALCSSGGSSAIGVNTGTVH